MVITTGTISGGGGGIKNPEQGNKFLNQTESIKKPKTNKKNVGKVKKK